MRLASTFAVGSLGAAVFLSLSAFFPAAAESFRNPDGVAAIIGNRAYEHRDVPDVEYAHRDAAAFRRYVVDVLGFDPENVLDLRDATKAQLESAFGNRDSHRGLLWRYLAPDGGSDVVVFYSGHGVPGLNDGRGYLLPSDTDAATAEINGYPIDVLLSNLDRLEDEARSVRVYLDACFSGSSHSGRLVRDISGPVIVELRPVEPESRMTVLTAASGDQVASWDRDAGHGLFTHHLLDALYGLGDKDGDGSVTAGEAKSWLDDYMTRAARRSLGRIQEADLVGDGSAVLASAASSEGGFPARPVLPPDPSVVPFDVAPLDDVLVALSDVPARLGPGVAYEAAGTIARDAEVTVTGSVTVSGVGWLRVSLPGGVSAFVPASALGERGPAPEAVEAALDLSWSGRVLVQRGLAHVGFDPGPADGVFGRRTRGAIESYQRDKGLRATGYLTAELGDALIALGGVARREEEAYAHARSAGTEESWASYLSSYPAGRHADEARRERDRLRAEAAVARREAEERRAAAVARREADERPAEEAARLARERPRRPGSVFRDCADCPEMVVVPAGSFMMGSPSSEAGRDDDEGPRHRVTISAPFAVGVHEVTRGQFGRFVSVTGRAMGNSCWAHEGGEWKNRSGRGWRSPGFGQSDAHPVVCVSWDDAQAYVRWLSGETGKSYRLLSESEWEYVARAGSSSSRYWGNDPSDACRYANVADRTAKEEHPDWPWMIHECRDGHVYTAPVGRYAANDFGLHDVLGNVWEWTADCWNDSYAGAPDDGRAWTRGECSRRVLRGGSWYVNPRNVRAAYRFRDGTGARNNDLGFRLARTFAP